MEIDSASFFTGAGAMLLAIMVISVLSLSWCVAVEKRSRQLAEKMSEKWRREAEEDARQ
jgi:hypothetical protein